MLRISPTGSAKNLSVLVDIAENAEVGVGDGDCKDKTDEKLTRSKNWNRAIGYLTPYAKQAFTQLR